MHLRSLRRVIAAGCRRMSGRYARCDMDVRTGTGAESSIPQRAWSLIAELRAAEFNKKGTPSV
jgi:hypothetical protein